MLNTKRLIRTALEEDIGHGDVTTDALVGSDRQGKAIIVAKEPLVLAGLSVAQEVFSTLDGAVGFETSFEDGDRVETGGEILSASGKLHSLLVGERTALNFLQHLSGIATFARQFVEQVGKFSVRITDTRKTTPGLRVLEKHAVKVGGGHNHRFGLYDGILIKDNHIKACGGITEAVTRIRRQQGHLLRIEVEVTNAKQAEEALGVGVDVIMLDNMNLSEIQESVKLIGDRAVVEVSGGIDLETVSSLAKTGVDIISVGAITHSARAVDMSMRIIEA